MPGDVSTPYPGEPICKCEHFKSVHDWKTGVCEGEGCTCTKFTEIPFDESEFGKSVNAYLDQFKAPDEAPRTRPAR